MKTSLIKNNKDNTGYSSIRVLPSSLFITAILVILSFACLSFNFSATDLAFHSPSCTAHSCLNHAQIEKVTFGKEAAEYLKEVSPYFDRKCNPNYRIKKVVIDPGHGGYDSGCSGTNSKEKHLALAIAKKMKASLERNFQDIEVILTRDRDVFIPLNKRAAIANDWNADLFISVHCNAMSNADYVKGTETYVLGANKLKENLEIAKRENASILLEENYEQTYNFDPYSDEGHITMSLYQNAFLEQSLLFASKVEEKISHISGMKSRGVKQAGFLVLRETAMPSVLIEAGYLTNATDQRLLKSESGQNQIAKVVLDAFIEYKNTLENDSVEKTDVQATPMPVSNYEKKAIVKTIAKESYEVAPKVYAPTRAAPSVQYKIQLAAAANTIDTSKGDWLNISEYIVEVIQEDGMFKYQARGYYSFQEAQMAQAELQRRGFKRAWIVAYNNGEKIKIGEARKLLGE